MRVAAAVIGGLGATLGAFKGFNIVLGTLLLTVSGDDTGFNPLGLRGPAPGFDPFLVLWGSTEGGAAISCVLGMIGAGLVIAGRLRTGAWLMLAGAMGVVASAYTYILLQPVAMGPAFEPYLSPGLLPARPWHVQALFPVPPLLVGAALAFLARSRSRS